MARELALHLLTLGDIEGYAHGAAARQRSLDELEEAPRTGDHRVPLFALRRLRGAGKLGQGLCTAGHCLAAKRQSLAAHAFTVGLDGLRECSVAIDDRKLLIA